MLLYPLRFCADVTLCVAALLCWSSCWTRAISYRCFYKFQQGITVASSAVGIVLFLRKIVDIEGVSENGVLCNFIPSVNLQFLGKLPQIQIFTQKNTPVHWGKFHLIKQEYSSVQGKKFMGLKPWFQTDQSYRDCIDHPKNKMPRKLRRLLRSVRTGSQWRSICLEIGNLGRL